MVFVCHGTLQDHRTKVLYDFMVKIPSMLVTIRLSLVAIGTAVSEL